MAQPSTGRNASMRSGTSRRTVLKTAALASAAVITAPYVRGAYAAGKLTLGCWDHWVPGANTALTKICNEWGEKNKVEVHIDYILSLIHISEPTRRTPIS